MSEARRRAQLAESDVRAIVRLLGELAGGKGGRAARKRLLMARLSELVGADMWICGIGTINTPERRPVLLSVQYDHIAEDEAAAITRYGQDHDRPLPENQYCLPLIERGRHWTRRRDQIVGDDVWYGDPVNVARHREMGYDEFLYSVYPVTGEGAYSVLAFYRRFGRPRFTDRDVRLVHIVASEVDWLHREEEPARQEATVARLTPRERAVFTLLLDGWDRQSIARAFGLSSHTVRDYMKRIYRRFGVDGHVALLRRFMDGDEAPGSGR